MDNRKMKRELAWPGILCLACVFLMLAAPSQARMIAVDGEALADVRAQSLISFSVDERNVHTSDATWPWNPDGYVRYDAMVLKVDEELSISNLHADRASMGWYNDGSNTGWDIDINGDYASPWGRTDSRWS